MQTTDWLQLFLLFLTVVALTPPVGAYLCRVFDPHKATFFDVVLKPVERFFYRACAIDPRAEQTWKEYFKSVAFFIFLSTCGVSVLLALQGWLPLNPQQFKAPSWHLNLNTAVSFATNTDWQSYSGEIAMSYFSQMAVLTVQNFTAAAASLCVAVAFVRGLARKEMATIGHFWTDLVRSTLYLFLPIAILGAAVLLFEGVPQNWSPYIEATTLEGNTQIIAQGPIASQGAISLLGNGGGGFMGTNAAHPYQNPTPLTNFIQMVLIFLLPAAQIFAFGLWVKDTKHAWYIFAAIALIFIGGAVTCGHAEGVTNPEWADLGLVGGNWEGKEIRCGLFGSSLYACISTAINCGALNCMLDSFSPIGGLIPMLNMQLGSAIFGGVGGGLYSILLFVLLALFIAGLVIGRTPEYLGKKIEAYDIKMAVLATLPYVVLVHAFTSAGCLSQWGLAGLGNSGPHGFSEILYAFSSAAANNGSAFAGLNTNMPIYNVTLAIAIALGKFLLIAPVLALAGSFAAKQVHPKTFPIASPLFVALLIGVIFLLGALTFLPAWTMGPILEQLFALQGRLFG